MPGGMGWPPYRASVSRKLYSLSILRICVHFITRTSIVLIMYMNEIGNGFIIHFRYRTIEYVLPSISDGYSRISWVALYAWKLHCSGPWRVLLSTSKSTSTVVALGSFSFFFSAEASWRRSKTKPNVQRPAASGFFSTTSTSSSSHGDYYFSALCFFFFFLKKKLYSKLSIQRC